MLPSGLRLASAIVDRRLRRAMPASSWWQEDLRGSLSNKDAQLGCKKATRGPVCSLPQQSVMTSIDNQVVSKQRVADHGEVYTHAREVNAMLDLVKQETDRIDSRFLEPACGNGNFLAAILERKLCVVEDRYARSQLDYERNVVLAVSSVYGIDKLQDNVHECRARLFVLFDSAYSARFKRKAQEACRRAVRFILEQNIVHGDALKLKTVVGENDVGPPIHFSEWSFARGSFLKRRVFTFRELMPPNQSETKSSLFADSELPLSSDLGGDVFIPTPVREYPMTHFLKVADADAELLAPFP